MKTKRTFKELQREHTDLYRRSMENAAGSIAALEMRLVMDTLEMEAVQEWQKPLELPEDHRFAFGASHL